MNRRPSARAASRAMARADTAAKNRALLLIAAPSAATPTPCAPPTARPGRGAANGLGRPCSTA
jgi:hypothetical protein